MQMGKKMHLFEAWILHHICRPSWRRPARGIAANSVVCRLRWTYPLLRKYAAGRDIQLRAKREEPRG
jgi:hypothetical protein